MLGKGGKSKSHLGFSNFTELWLWNESVSPRDERESAGMVVAGGVVVIVLSIRNPWPRCCFHKILSKHCTFITYALFDGDRTERKVKFSEFTFQVEKLVF